MSENVVNNDDNNCGISFLVIVWNCWRIFLGSEWKKYTLGHRYWNSPLLVNTGTFLMYQYCPKMCYLHSLQRIVVFQKLTILECKNDLVLTNTWVLVSGTYSMLFLSEFFCWSCICPWETYFGLIHLIRRPQDLKQLWFIKRYMMVLFIWTDV